MGRRCGTPRGSPPARTSCAAAPADAPWRPPCADSRRAGPAQRARVSVRRRLQVSAATREKAAAVLVSDRPKVWFIMSPQTQKDPNSVGQPAGPSKLAEGTEFLGRRGGTPRRAAASAPPAAPTAARGGLVVMSRSTVPPRTPLSRPLAPRPSRFFRPRLTAVVALALLPLVSVSAQGPHAPPRGVIAAEGGRFVDPTDGSTFRVAGANCYYLAYSSGADGGSYEHAWVEEVLDEASSLGLNVLRLWAFQDQWWEGERALQPAPGTYNERFLVALDGLIARAAARGIRLLLCLTNYWEDYGARSPPRTAVSSPPRVRSLSPPSTQAGPSPTSSGPTPPESAPPTAATSTAAKISSPPTCVARGSSVSSPISSPASTP